MMQNPNPMKSTSSGPLSTSSWPGVCISSPVHSPEQTAAIFKADLEKYTKVANAANIRAE